ncbi:MAG: ribbon-helix-helix protein, CopG family [Actinobacteria bacterium]|nr:ribbon-helix-helix protein, CopG family [Actinomycetota bacterium]
MKRISFYIREDQIKNLDSLAGSKGISSAELIREAIDYKLLAEFGKTSKEEIISNTKGLLKDRFKKDKKSEEIVNNLRAEWEQRIERNKK